MKGQLASTPQRRALMGRVRQKGTAPELAVGAALRALNKRFRKNVRTLPGTPDFANKSEQWAVLVHGCFWHRHNSCARATIPRRNYEFWTAKFVKNTERDAETTLRLITTGYRVFVIWECEITGAGARLREFFESRCV